jgi:hypothetical protein
MFSIIGDHKKVKLLIPLEKIVEAPSLMSPDFSQDFTLYTFASDRSYVVVLTQKMLKAMKYPLPS